MEFRILGPVEVIHDGRAVALGGSRERAVLALLLASANRVVSSDRLAEDLWGGEAPARAAHSLQVFVSRLRKSLRAVGADEIIVTRPPGYLADVAAEALDVIRFESLVATGRRSAAAGAPAEAAAAFHQALALWRGPALADIADGPIARADAARLEEARLAAIEERIEADLACGRHSELAAELDGLTRANPLRERFWAQRMLALYRCGRQVEALRAHRDLRDLLVEEVGLEPSPALAALETAILQQDPALNWRPPLTEPAGRDHGAAKATPPAAAVPGPDLVRPGHVGPPIVTAAAPVETPADLASLAARPVTILFSDIEGSTDLRTGHGDQIAQELLARHDDLIRAEVRAHGGVEVKALGDGFMIAFGSARAALACAVAIQRATAAGLQGAGLKVRIGLNTGEVVYQHGDLYGQAVHAAARIAAQATGGEILVAEIVKHLVGASPDITFGDRGRSTLKGFPEQFHLYDVTWADPEPTPMTVGFAARTPYVGREAETAELTALLERACRGQGSLVLLGGEAGVGKTRLTEEIGTAAAARGARVLVGRCYELDGAPPYVPFVEILEQALAGAPSVEAFRAFLGDDAPEVAKLVPRLRRLCPDIPPPLELPPEQERHFLFNSLRDYLARAAAGRPLFLVFDDLHWADDGTLLLLEHVAEQLPRLAVLAVGTYRDNEVTADHRLARPLEALRRRHLARRINLGRLAEDGVAALLRALSGQEPPASLVAAVHAETQGNPFFAEEIYKHLAEEGRLFSAGGQFRDDVDINDLDVPESLRLVLGRRLERLGDDGRRALAAAAVLGRAFTYELLEALDEVPADVLLDVLDEAERARLVTPLSNAPGEDRLLFSHELIRQTLLTGLSQPRRRRLHLRVADTLERLHADSLDTHASEIAHHLTRAGPAADRHRLLTSLTLAGRQAMRTAGYEDALRHFDQAVAMGDAAQPGDRPELFADRALAQRSLGHLEDALPDWDRALADYERLGDVEAAARMCLQASLDLWWLNRDGEAVTFAERGLATLANRETPQRVEMLAWTAVAGAWVSPYAPGAKLIDEALTLAERLGDKRLVAYGLVNRALHCNAFGLQREAIEFGQEGTGVLRAGGDLWEVATLLPFMEGAAFELGRLDLAVVFGDEAELLATRLGHAFALFAHALVRASRQLATDSAFSQTGALVREQCGVEAAQPFRHITGAFLAHLAYLEGRWDDALALAAEAVHHSPDGHGTAGGDWGCYLRVLAYSGRGGDVVSVVDERHAELPEPGHPNRYGSWHLLTGAIEALTVIGQRERAAALYPLVQELLVTTGLVTSYFYPYLIERIAGIGAASANDWDAAEAHFRSALRHAEQLPFEIEGAETRRWYARMLLDRGGTGDAEQARILASEALAVYRRIGMPRHEELARGLPG